MPKSDTPDFAALWNDAVEDFIPQYKDMRRQVRDETTRPMEGEKMGLAERAAFNARILGDETTIGGMFEELSARFQVPEGKAPRRLVEAILRAAREEP